METNVPGSRMSVAGSSVDSVSKAAHETIDSVAKAADTAVGKAKSTTDTVASKAHGLVDRAAEAAAPASDWLNKQAQIARTAQEKFLKETSELVSARPMTAIAIALAVGYLLGKSQR